MTQPPQIDMKNTTLYIRDAGTNYIEIRVGEGNFTYSAKRNLEFITSRGTLDRVREGEEVPCSISFQFMWEHIATHSGEVVALEDAFRAIGGASAWKSTNLTDPDAPYCVDLVLANIQSCAAFNFDEQLYFSKFYLEEFAHDLQAGTVDGTGKANIVFPTVS